MKYRYFYGIFISLFIMISMILIPSSGYAQSGYSMNILYVNDTEFPNVEISVSAVDPKGHQIPGLTKTNFTLLEDGLNIPDFAVSQGVDKNQPLSLVLAIDTSNQSEEQFNQLIEAIKSFIKGIETDDLIAIVSFSDEVKIEKELSSEKVVIDQILEELEIGGNTSLYDGLDASIELLSDRPESKAIIVITNGTDSGTSVSTIEDVHNKLTSNNIQLYSLGFGGAVNLEELDQISQDSGGDALSLKGVGALADELKEAFSQIGTYLDEVLRNRYLLNYQSDISSNGSIHELKIIVNYQGWQAEDTAQITACPGVVKVCLPDYYPEDTIGDNYCLAPIIQVPNPPVKKLEIFIDGSLLCSSSSSFECCLKPGDISEGEHQFKLIVTDSADLQGENNVTLNVVPTIDIEASGPEPGQSYTSRLNTSGDIFSLNEIERIQFVVDNTTLDEIIRPELPPGGPPFIYSFEEELDISRLRAGNNVLVIQTEDNTGYLVSYEVPFTVRSIIMEDEGPPWELLIVGGIIIGAAILIAFATRKGRKARGSGLQKGEAGLREVEGLNPGQLWLLSSTEEIRIGRKSEVNDIPLKGLKASREMAVIRSSENKYYIYSIKTDNPILVNQNPVINGCELIHGDEIRGGDSVFIFEISE